MQLDSFVCKLPQHSDVYDYPLTRLMAYHTLKTKPPPSLCMAEKHKSTAAPS